MRTSMCHFTVEVVHAILAIFILLSTTLICSGAHISSVPMQGKSRLEITKRYFTIIIENAKDFVHHIQIRSKQNAPESFASYSACD